MRSIEFDRLMRSTILEAFKKIKIDGMVRG